MSKFSLYYKSGNKVSVALCKENGVSQITLTRWIKQCSTLQVDNGKVLTAKWVRKLQKRNFQLEKENLI